MILIDEPMWPRHGRVWGHVVSDTSLAELHAFAVRAGFPERGFDLDHYDYPVEQQGELIALGASLVSAHELTRRLIASGLRIRARDRGGGGSPGSAAEQAIRDGSARTRGRRDD